MSWEECKLGDIVNLKRGYDLPKRLRKEGDVPIISSAGISGFHSEEKCNGEGVITGRYGTLGEVFYVNGKYWPLNTTLYAQDFKNNYPKFIYYLLKELKIEQYNGAAAVPGLDRNVLHLIKCSIPPLQTQKRIADILSAYDDLIENNLQRIQLLEQAAQNIYKEWFVHLRFPGHEDTPIDEETGLPEGWEEVKIGDFAKINESSIKKGRSPEFINYVDISSVGSGFYKKPINIAFKDAPSRARRIVKDGDSIFSTVRPNRKTFAFISDPRENLTVSTGFAVISPKFQHDTSFIYFTISSNSFIAETVALATGAAYPAINQKSFESIEIIVPSEELRIRFNSIVIKILNLKSTLLSQNEKLSKARDILLPRLMNRTIAV